MEDTLTFYELLSVLGILVVLSAMFSASETALMSINRYRLKHNAKTNVYARYVLKLLERPDRLLTLILICNNFVNNLAAAIATVIGMKYLSTTFGEGSSLTVSTIAVTLFILIFGEILPKTFAVIRPEIVAYPLSVFLKVLMVVLYPLIILINMISTGLLKLFGVRHSPKNDGLSKDELKTIVLDSNKISVNSHQTMLAKIFDLEDACVKDIMVPKGDVYGIDISKGMPHVIQKIANSKHTLLPVYKEDFNSILGVIHVRDILPLLINKNLTVQKVLSVCVPPYFIPESTTLNKQLIQFQNEKRRMGIVVDEYGEVLGIATLEDILEEIVGQFTSDISMANKIPHLEKDGSFLVDGSVSVKELNNLLGWNLPLDGPKTIGGLIIEHLEMIPNSYTCLKLDGHKLEVVLVKDNMIKSVRIID